jgi:hypothetical protein
MAENEAVNIYFMWPTADGEGWVVATKFDGDLETVFEKVKAAGLPKPIPVERTPQGWGGISDKKR